MSQKAIPYLQSCWINNQIYLDYLNRIQILAMSLFEWKGLPKTCDARFLEESLYYYGKAVLVKDKNVGYLNLNAVTSGKLNVYNLPTEIEAFSVGYSKRYPADECVLIMNNLLMRPTLWTAQLYAMELYEIQAIKNVNVKAQKTPTMLSCTNNQRLTLMNLYQKYDGNQPFIFSDKSQDLGKMISSIKTDAPYLADKLQLLKNDVWNEMLSFLGINNANTDKKERLIVDEVESNNELISMDLNTFLLTRKEACEKINEMFPDLHVSVEFREDVKQKIQKLTDEMQKIGENESEGDEDVRQ